MDQDKTMVERTSERVMVIIIMEILRIQTAISKYQIIKTRIMDIKEELGFGIRETNKTKTRRLLKGYLEKWR